MNKDLALKLAKILPAGVGAIILEDDQITVAVPLPKSDGPITVGVGSAMGMAMLFTWLMEGKNHDLREDLWRQLGEEAGFEREDVTEVKH